MKNLRRNGKFRILLVLVWLGTIDIGPSRAQSATSSADQISTAAATLDLSDPRIQQRLRAAGIDPDELRKMLEARQSNGPSSAAEPEVPEFPPVTPPPAMAAHDTVAVDSTSVAPEHDYFGYSIFTMSPKTFEPLAFGPVSTDYLIGPGDEIIVNVWGAQEMSANAEVNREGYILIPDLGQVLVNGVTLSGLQQSLTRRLSKIYSGIRSDGQGQTFVDVSLGKLRSIQVFVLGNVVQPGGYTMSATTTVMNALYYAGGPTLQGSMRHVRVMRTNKLLREIDLYDYVVHGDRTQDSRLENGDVVFVTPVGVRVELEGEVQHPAIYELREGDSLGNLFELAGGLRSTAYLKRVQVERTIPFDERAPMAQEDRKVFDFDLSKVQADSVRLVDGDVVRVFRVGDILRNTVSVSGEAVYKPGTYQYRNGMTVADLITMAGGVLGDAYMQSSHLVRTTPDKSRQLFSFSLDLALKRDPAHDQKLQPLDEVQVFSVWDMREKEYVSIEGLVRRPSRYDLLEGMTLTDLVVQAGGLKESAYVVRAEVARIDPSLIGGGKTAELIQVALGDSEDASSPASQFVLQKNDIVFIREIPNWGLQESVWITGEVRFPGKYALTSKRERLSSIVDRAGGLEATAYLRGATFVRTTDRTGRMAIDFEEALKDRKKPDRPNKYDLIMAASDSVHIPLEPTTVKVMGEVGFPSSVLWEDGRNVDHYIDQAGGLLETADSGKIQVILANGRVKRPGWFSSPKPDAGALVIVPEKPEAQDGEALKNIAQIVSILSGAATTIYLISRTN